MLDGAGGVPLSDFNRRAFVAYFASAGLTSTLLPGTLWAQIKPGSRTITVAMVREAARLAGLDWTDAECQDLAASLSSLAANVDRIDKLTLSNASPLPFHFNPRPPGVALDLPQSSGVRLARLLASRVRRGSKTSPFCR